MPGDLSLQVLGKELASVPELLRGIRAELQGIRLAMAGEWPIAPRSAKDQLLNTAQAAELLGLSETTLSTWRSNRRAEVPYLKIGGRVRYKRSDLEAWVKSRRHGGTPVD